MDAAVSPNEHGDELGHLPTWYKGGLGFTSAFSASGSIGEIDSTWVLTNGADDH